MSRQKKLVTPTVSLFLLSALAASSSCSVKQTGPLPMDPITAGKFQGPLSAPPTEGVEAKAPSGPVVAPSAPTASLEVNPAILGEWSTIRDFHGTRDTYNFSMRIHRQANQVGVSVLSQCYPVEPLFPGLQAEAFNGVIVSADDLAQPPRFSIRVRNVTRTASYRCKPSFDIGRDHQGKLINCIYKLGSARTQTGPNGFKLSCLLASKSAQETEYPRDFKGTETPSWEGLPGASE